MSEEGLMVCDSCGLTVLIKGIHSSWKGIPVKPNSAEIRWFCREKWFKQVLPVLRINAFSGIPDAYDYPVFLFSAVPNDGSTIQKNLDNTPVLYCLHCV